MCLGTLHSGARRGATGMSDETRMENASVEVWREGPEVWIAIRSEQSVGKAVALSRDEAREVAGLLTRSANGDLRPIRDNPQA
jgi:hypothetical protein